MRANFDGTNAEHQPKKNTEDIKSRKNQKNTSNEKQISEKKEQKKNKSWADKDHQRSIQTEDSEWTLMVKNQRKNIQRPLTEDLYIGNLTNDTTEEEILSLLGLGGTTYLREDSLVRRQ